jgi:hypothetical protein
LSALASDKRSIALHSGELIFRHSPLRTRFGDEHPKGMNTDEAKAPGCRASGGTGVAFDPEVSDPVKATKEMRRGVFDWRSERWI